MKEIVRSYLSDLINALSQVKLEGIDAALSICDTVRSENGTLYVCGNGGSAASAMHAACDFLKATATSDQYPLRTIALSSNPAMVTARANDDGFENVFVKQIEHILTPADAVLGISTSGRSENITRAIKYASSVGAKTIFLTGVGAEQLHQIASTIIEVPDAPIQVVEDVHMALLHSMSVCLQKSSTSIQ